MATLNFSRIIMEKKKERKKKFGVYCYFIADILSKDFWKCLLSGSLLNMYFLSKPLNLIGCHGNQKAKFAKNQFLRNRYFDRSFFRIVC